MNFSSIKNTRITRHIRFQKPAESTQFMNFIDELFSKSITKLFQNKANIKWKKAWVWHIPLLPQIKWNITGVHINRLVFVSWSHVIQSSEMCVLPPVCFKPIAALMECPVASQPWLRLKVASTTNVLCLRGGRSCAGNRSRPFSAL